MALSETQSAIVIDTILADVLQEFITCRLPLDQSCKSGLCQKFLHTLSITPCIEGGAEDDDLDKIEATNVIDAVITQCPRPVKCLNCCHIYERGHCWHSWIVQALAEDSSDDEVEIYKRNLQNTKLTHSASQTVKRFRKRYPGLATPGDRLISGPAPCELTRQTIFIDTVPTPAPNLQNRSPVSDRFCYMLTDFASALYCSLAIMCCCTPSMFR